MNDLPLQAVVISDNVHYHVSLPELRYATVVRQLHRGRSV